MNQQRSTWDWGHFFGMGTAVLLTAVLFGTMAHCNATKPERIRACREACAPETVRSYGDGEGCVCN